MLVNIVRDARYHPVDKNEIMNIIMLMNLFMPKTHEQKQILPQNKLQRLAFMRGYRSASEFAVAVSKAGVVSYGTAYKRWDGRAGKTQYDILLAIAKFLGENTVEQVFDP